MAIRASFDVIVTEGAETTRGLQAIRRRGGPGSGDRRRPMGRLAETDAIRMVVSDDGGRAAGAEAGVATQATQQAMAFNVLGA